MATGTSQNEKAEMLVRRAFETIRSRGVVGGGNHVVLEAARELVANLEPGVHDRRKWAVSRMCAYGLWGITDIRMQQFVVLLDYTTLSDMCGEEWTTTFRVLHHVPSYFDGWLSTGNAKNMMARFCSESVVNLARCLECTNFYNAVWDEDDDIGDDCKMYELMMGVCEESWLATRGVPMARLLQGILFWGVVWKVTSEGKIGDVLLHGDNLRTRVDMLLEMMCLPFGVMNLCYMWHYLYRVFLHTRALGTTEVATGGLVQADGTVTGGLISAEGMVVVDGVALSVVAEAASRSSYAYLHKYGVTALSKNWSRKAHSYKVMTHYNMQFEPISFPVVNSDGTVSIFDRTTPANDLYFYSSNETNKLFATLLLGIQRVSHLFLCALANMMIVGASGQTAVGAPGHV